jgi:hypothetical protein
VLDNHIMEATASVILTIALPKGRKDDIKAAADTAVESLNGYIAKAVDERMTREKPG